MASIPHSISKVVEVVEENTGGALKEVFEHLQRLYWKDGICGWQDILYQKWDETRKKYVGMQGVRRKKIQGK